MDLSTDFGMLSSHTAFEELVLEQESSLSGSYSQTESGGTILLQLLEFKTHLHEVVEELHIRRAKQQFLAELFTGRRGLEVREDVLMLPDIPEQHAETRFENQISQLVLEKQELEWAKESLQHQTETMTNQHSESLSTVKKQFQVKLQHTEEEKGKYQVSAELKAKEINNLKEELKSLQLLKFNFEKKSSELEQKLALQNRTRDAHLNQLGEVEKRFAALSRQCAMVKEAHGKLGHNVDEAMKINTKLTSANQRQEETIVALKKELDGACNKLIKEKMKSAVNEKTHSPARREQHLQELQQKLKMESEMVKKLEKDNVAERAEKQELMRSLQQNQQLLLNQTQMVRRLEQELQTQRQMFQTLKQEHEVMQENSKAMDDKVVQLTESYAASRTSWDEEKTKFLEQLEREQEQLRAMNYAYEELQEKHAELSVQARSEIRHADKQEIKEDTQSFCVSTDGVSSMVEDIRSTETLNDQITGSEPPDLGSLQHSDSSQTKISEPPEHSGDVFKLPTSRAGEGQDMSNQQQHPQTIKRVLNIPNTFTCRSNNLPDNSGAETEMKGLEKNFEMTDLIVSDEGHQGASNPECVSPDGASDLLTRNTDEEWNTGMNVQGVDDKRKQENNRELQETDAEQKKTKDVKDGRHTQEKCTLTAQTADGIGMLQDTEGSAKATGETSNPEAETRDKGEGQVTDGVKEKEQTAEHATETQIPALTIADTTEKSLTLQVNDFTHVNPPLTDCEPSNSSQNLCQKVTEEKKKDCETCNSEDVQSNFTDEVLTPHLDCEPQNNQSVPVNQSLKHETETAAKFPSQCSEILKRSSSCASQTNASSQDNKVREGETNQTQTEIDNPFYTDPSIEKADERFDAHVSEEDVSVTKTERQSEEVQENVQLRSAVADDEGDASKRRESYLNKNACESDTCESAQISETSSSKGVTRETNTAAGKTQEQVETDETEADLKLSVQPSHTKVETSEAGSSELHQQPLKRTKPGSSESTLTSRKTPRSLFEWSTAQRETFSSRGHSDFSILREFTQGTPQSEPNKIGHPLKLTPTSITSKHNKVPLVITKASDLLSASNVSAAAAYLKSQQQEEKVKEVTCKEKAVAANTDRRPRLFISPFPVSSTSSQVLKQTSSECSRAPSSTAGCSESDLEPSCSQEREDQQSSFRDQISKIEQFLNSERLRLPKRRRIDN